MKRVVLVTVVFATSLLLWSTVALAASYNVYICGGWSNSPGPFAPAAVAGTEAVAANCGGADGAALVIAAPGPQVVPNGQGASWTATAPPHITITHTFTVNDKAAGVGDNNGWWGEFFWDGGPGPSGRSAQMSDSFGQFGCCQASFNNRRVGWFMSCGWSSCNRPATIDVGGVDLAVNEDKGPWLNAPYGLWQASGWVRDKWQLAFYGDSPSGVCNLYASISGQAVMLGAGASVGRVQSTWHQCSGAGVSPTIQTADYGQGLMALTIAGCDAAGACTNNSVYTKTIQVDNSRPWVSLASPGNASSTAGTQYVTATAGGSPSGIAEIDCSVDGGPIERYSERGAQQPSAELPVSGLGEHGIQCSAANTAVAQDGSHGWSATPASATLKIGEPTLAGISFSKLVNAPLCRRVREHVTVAGRWVTVRRHHKPVRVKQRAHRKLVTVTRCHLRVARRKITVWATVSRHGKKMRVRRSKTVRVPLFPRVVTQSSKRVAFGKATTVSGWLGTTDGTALAGQVIRVLAAPDNDLGQFAQVAATTTTANGSWTAELPPGPSRLIEATYDGGPTTEPSISTQVRLIVPARVKLLSIFPTRAAWGGTVRIVGRLMGGYLPTGGALVRLRIGLGSAYTTYGVQEHVTGNGMFSTTYTFGVGDPSMFRSYWFQIASLPMGNYPWAPADSGKRSVLVGGHPSIPPRTHHHGRRRHHHRRIQ